MSGLAWNTQFESMYLYVAHIILHTCRDRTEVMVVHLLILGTVVSHQRATRHHKVGTSGIECFVNKEILLFPTQIAHNLLHFGIEQLCHSSSSLINSIECLLQRHFIVERLTCITDEDGRNHQSVSNDENRTCRVPGTISASFERTADTTAWKRTGIGFLLYEQLTFEFLNHSALAVVFHEAVVFLCRSFGQWLKPVSIMCHTILDGPCLDALSYLVSNCPVERSTIVNDITHLLVCLRRQILAHLLLIEDVLTKIFRRASLRYCHLYGLTLKRLVHNL